MIVIQDLSASATTNVQHIIQLPPLTQQAEISLITCSPSEDAVFTVYGHTALRVYDPVTNIDIAFNYGIFDFDQPNFIYRFAKGETDYMLGVTKFDFFLFEYRERGSEVYEQVLNLRHEEKETLWRTLEWNMQPANREYRYNFFFDNCATRPVVLIEKNIQGIIQYTPPTEDLSFRDAINYCTRYRPWQTFGCDLVVGLPADRPMTQSESFFIPDIVKNEFNSAKIIRNGQSEPLVKKINILAKATSPLTPETYNLKPTPSPLLCFSALFLILLALTYIERRRKTHFRLIDIILFFSAGIAGCILFFLSFFSVHPCMFPNINLLWLHPLHLAGIVLFSIKKLKTLAYWYHLINFAVVISMSAAWFFIPQHFNIAFIPLIACLLLRSGGALVRKNKTTG